jgi:predicted AAA+ superfamily ATPase
MKTEYYSILIGEQMIYIHRAIEDFILKNAGSFPCITLYGPRQVGKSTTADVLFGNRFKEVNLDGLADRALANQNPALFLDTYGWPLIIDEVQKATPLLSEIKKKIDSQRKLWRKEGKKQELMYVLTGSSRFELVKAVTESLAGRSAMLEMTYLDQS